MKKLLRSFLILLGISVLLAFATTLYSLYQIKKHGFKVYYVVNGKFYDKYPFKKPVRCNENGISCRTYVAGDNLFIVLKGDFKKALSYRKTDNILIFRNSKDVERSDERKKGNGRKNTEGFGKL